MLRTMTTAALARLEAEFTEVERLHHVALWDGSGAEALAYLSESMSYQAERWTKLGEWAEARYPS